MDRSRTLWTSDFLGKAAVSQPIAIQSDRSTTSVRCCDAEERGSCTSESAVVRVAQLYVSTRLVAASDPESDPEGGDDKVHDREEQRKVGGGYAQDLGGSHHGSCS